MTRTGIGAALAALMMLGGVQNASATYFVGIDVDPTQVGFQDTFSADAGDALQFAFMIWEEGENDQALVTRVSAEATTAGPSTIDTGVPAVVPFPTSLLFAPVLAVVPPGDIGQVLGGVFYNIAAGNEPVVGTGAANATTLFTFTGEAAPGSTIFDPLLAGTFTLPLGPGIVVPLGITLDVGGVTLTLSEGSPDLQLMPGTVNVADAPAPVSLLLAGSGLLLTFGASRRRQA